MSQAQSAELSLMLRKSVEARDWLNTVMRRVVENVTIIDEQVRQLCKVVKAEEDVMKLIRSRDEKEETH